MTFASTTADGAGRFAALALANDFRDDFTPWGVSVGVGVGVGVGVWVRVWGVGVGVCVRVWIG